MIKMYKISHSQSIPITGIFMALKPTRKENDTFLSRKNTLILQIHLQTLRVSICPTVILISLHLF